jgi:hypothetical protein
MGKPVRCTHNRNNNSLSNKDIIFFNGKCQAQGRSLLSIIHAFSSFCPTILSTLVFHPPHGCKMATAVPVITFMLQEEKKEACVLSVSSSFTSLLCTRSHTPSQEPLEWLDSVSHWPDVATLSLFTGEVISYTHCRIQAALGKRVDNGFLVTTPNLYHNMDRVVINWLVIVLSPYELSFPQEACSQPF